MRPSELPDELRIVAMASGALVALLNTTNNRCYSTLREFFVPHQRLLVLLRLDHDPYTPKICDIHQIHGGEFQL